MSLKQTGGGVVHNVSICVRAGLSKPRPVPDTERNKDMKRWITRQPRLTQIHCVRPVWRIYIPDGNID
jgi:hypothetical protein